MSSGWATFALEYIFEFVFERAKFVQTNIRKAPSKYIYEIRCTYFSLLALIRSDGKLWFETNTRGELKMAPG